MAKHFPLDSPGFHPFGELIGLKFASASDGASACELDISPGLLNPHGVVHGGVIYSMADTGMGAAVYTVLEESELCATVEVKITYLNPAREGRLRCVTRVLKRSRNIAVLESKITLGDLTVALASGTFHIYTR